MTNQELITAYPEDAEILEKRLQTSEWFMHLARAAEKSHSLFSQKGRHGGGDDYVVKLNGSIVAVSFEDEDGDRHYMDLLTGSKS